MYIEFIALVLFVGCVWHAARYQGRAFAQQWFIAAYLFEIIRETIVQVVLQTYVYAPLMLHLGAAPAVTSLLWGSVFYLAFQFARRFAPLDRVGVIIALMFMIAVSLALPIEATAVQLRWWIYNRSGPVVFGGVPISAPLVWGGAAAVFYAVFARVRASRLPEPGRLYAMITLSPVIAIVHLLYSSILWLALGQIT